MLVWVEQDAVGLEFVDASRQCPQFLDNGQGLCHLRCLCVHADSVDGPERGSLILEPGLKHVVKNAPFLFSCDFNFKAFRAELFDS